MVMGPVARGFSWVISNNAFLLNLFELPLKPRLTFRKQRQAEAQPYRLTMITSVAVAIEEAVADAARISVRADEIHDAHL